MKTTWITEGRIWSRVMERQDQSLVICAVPQPIQATSRAPKFHWPMISKESVPYSRMTYQTVIDGRDGTTMLRVAYFSQ